MRDALRAEWTKLRTDPGLTWLLLAAVVLTAGVGAAAAATVRCPAAGCSTDPVRISLTGVTLGQAVVAVLAVLAVGNEYSTGMIRSTLAAMPRRWAVLTAKSAVVSAVVAAGALLAVLVSLLAGRLILTGDGFTTTSGHGPLSPADGSVVRAAVGSVLYLVLIALLALGTAMAVRDSATAIGTVLGLLYVLPILTQVVSDPHWRRHFQQLSPMSAGLNIQATTHLSTLPLSPWAGLGVLAAWSSAALLGGGLLLRHRDA